MKYRQCRMAWSFTMPHGGGGGQETAWLPERLAVIGQRFRLKSQTCSHVYEVVEVGAEQEEDETKLRERDYLFQRAASDI